MNKKTCRLNRGVSSLTVILLQHPLHYLLRIDLDQLRPQGRVFGQNPDLETRIEPNVRSYRYVGLKLDFLDSKTVRTKQNIRKQE